MTDRNWYRTPDNGRLTIERLNELFAYDPVTGIVTWRSRPNGTVQWNGKLAGKKVAVFANEDGYLRVKVDNTSIGEHRLIFILHFGRFPLGGIDHINGDPSDNRIENLREVSHRENCMNVKLRADNSSGVQGVHWQKRNKKWRAKINTANGRISLGLFSSLDDARRARETAMAKHGYHPNHGRSE